MTIPAFIVPTLVHYDLLQNMLDSVDTAIDHLVVIDNGGELSSVTCSNAHRTSIINLPTNIGVAGAWNLGIKLTPFSKWWVISNDDILWNPGSLDKFAQYIEDKSIVADWNPLSAFSGFALDEHTVRTVGLFDEFYFPANGEEVNYWRRANTLGISGIQVSSLFSLQGGIGRTRKTLDDQYPGTAGKIMDNINLAVTNTDRVVGWSLDKRRDFPF